MSTSEIKKWQVYINKQEINMTEDEFQALKKAIKEEAKFFFLRNEFLNIAYLSGGKRLCRYENESNFVKLK